MDAEMTEKYPFLKGGGELGALTRSFDWSTTPVESPDHWDQSLRLTVSMLLKSKFPMFLWWGDDLIQFYNDAYRPSMGNNGKHPLALGQKGKDCWPEIWEIIYPLIQQVLTTGEATWSEDQLIPIYRNGKIEDVYWTFGYSAIEGDTGTIKGVLVICTETTEKVQAQKLLEESERRFRTMAENTDILIATSDHTSHATYFNKAWTDFTGRSMKELLDFGWVDLIHEEDRQEFLELYLQAFKKQEPWTGRFRMLNKEGKYSWILSKGPLREGLGDSFNGYISSSIDITEQVKAQQEIEEIVAERTKELAEANSNFQKSNAELEQFAYIASHDLQEPLRKIGIYSQMLERSIGSKINDQEKGYIDKIRTSTDRMNRLIRDVLAFSEVTKQDEAFVNVDLNKVLENTKADYDLLIEQTGAVIKSNALPVLEAIPLQMSQLFGNMISNALKFARKDRTPEITVFATALTIEEKKSLSLPQAMAYCQLQFMDNGIGFKQEYANSIFNIFQRLHRKSDYEGTGIGLALCKKITVNHHGEINAEGSSENGAIFNIILPIRQNYV